MGVLCTLYNFLLRALLLAALLKSSLEILLINRETSRLIVHRAQHILAFSSSYVYLDADNVLRFIMKNQVLIT